MVDDWPNKNISYTHVDGRITYVAATGEKTYGSGENAKPFRYQLCPVFKIGQDETGEFWTTLRIYIRITDVEGVPFKKKGITRRRKKVANNWWNKEWFSRILAVIQSVSLGEESIEIGHGMRMVTVSTSPMQWECPVSIDYKAVERIGDFQQEIAELRYFDDNGDEDAEAVAPETTDIDEKVEVFDER